MITNYAKLLQNLPQLCKQSKNINELCKFCIKPKKNCFKMLIMQYYPKYARCMKPWGQLGGALRTW